MASRRPPGHPVLFASDTQPPSTPVAHVETAHQPITVAQERAAARVRVLASADDFNAASVLAKLQRGAYCVSDPRDDLFPNLHGAALREAVRQVQVLLVQTLGAAQPGWRRAAEVALRRVGDKVARCASSPERVHRLGHTLTRPSAAEPSVPLDGSLQASVDLAGDDSLSGSVDNDSRPPAFDRGRAMRRLAKGKDAGVPDMVRHAFAGLRGPALIRALNAVEEDQDGLDALSSADRQLVVSSLQDIRNEEPSLQMRRHTAERVRDRAGQREGDTLFAQVKDLPPSARRKVVRQAVSHKLDDVLAWHQAGAVEGDRPSLLLQEDPRESFKLLRDEAAQRRAEATHEGGAAYKEAIDAYQAHFRQQAPAPSDQAHLLWFMNAVTGELDAPAALEELTERLGSVPAVARTLLDWLDLLDDSRDADDSSDLCELTGQEERFLRRMVMVLVMRESQPLWAIADPERGAEVPHVLNPVPPHPLRGHPTPAQQAYYKQNRARAIRHIRLVKQDMVQVAQLLAAFDPHAGPAPGRRHTPGSYREMWNWLVSELPLSPDRLRLALAKIAHQKRPGLSERALGVLNEHLYSLQHVVGRHVPMSFSQHLRAWAGAIANGVREGAASHFLASLLMQMVAHYAGDWPGVLGVLGLLGGLVLPVGSAFYLHSLKTRQYLAQQSRTAELILWSVLLATPAAAGLLLAWFGISLSGGDDIASTAIYALVYNNFVRLLRQLLQSWTMGPPFADYTLVQADYTGLSAEMQQDHNVWRDVPYLGSCWLFLFVLPLATESQLKDWAGVVEDIHGVVRKAAVLSLWPGANEVLDGINPMLAKFFYWCAHRDTCRLQPGTQPNPGLDTRHFARNFPSRCAVNMVSDVSASSAEFAAHLKQPGLYYVLKFLGVTWAGVFGGGRGRVANYYATNNTVVDNGSVSPSGLPAAVGHGLMRAGGALWHASQWFGTHVHDTLWPPPPGRGLVLPDLNGGGEEEPDTEASVAEEDKDEAQDEGGGHRTAPDFAVELDGGGRDDGDPYSGQMGDWDPVKV